MPVTDNITAPTGMELETLPGAKPVLDLLDRAIEKTGGAKTPRAT